MVRTSLYKYRKKLAAIPFHKNVSSFSIFFFKKLRAWECYIFIYCTLLAIVCIFKKVSWYGFDIGVKCQGQILVTPVLWLLKRTHLSFLIKLLILSTMIAYGVQITTNISIYKYINLELEVYATYTENLSEDHDTNSLSGFDRAFYPLC